MLHPIKLKSNDKLSKVGQIFQGIARQIDSGKLRTNEQLPSINEFNRKYKVARDTVEKAYGKLKEENYIISVAGRGYFVLNNKKSKLHVLIVFNKLSFYKQIVYENILQTLGDKAIVDLKIHHYNPNFLRDIIETSKGKYHYYIIMPHFFDDAKKEECLEILQSVPNQELILLDKQVPELEGVCTNVYQDFRWDILNALNEVSVHTDKYKFISLIFPQNKNHPTEIKDGIAEFCIQQTKKFSIFSEATTLVVEKHTAYIVLTENDLAQLIKNINQAGFTLGKDVGIISFNETVLKEVLNITVISTDFAEMGRLAAHSILSGKVTNKKNPFKVIMRGSL